MDLMEAVHARHAVRAFKETPIASDSLAVLRQEIEKCNQESGLQIQLCTNEPEAFSGFLAHYGRFRNVRNYIALVGNKSEEGLETTCGYYGEKIVLKAQQLGLNTCWVAVTYKKGQVKKTVKIGRDQEMVIVIALGYGETQGEPRKTKAVEDLCKVSGDMPDWFRRGMEAAQLAPTAINQQKFIFALEGNRVKSLAGFGPNAKIDLGIAKCHFEIGAGPENWEWEC